MNYLKTLSVLYLLGCYTFFQISCAAGAESKDAFANNIPIENLYIGDAQEDKEEKHTDASLLPGIVAGIDPSCLLVVLESYLPNLPNKIDLVKAIRNAKIDLEAPSKTKEYFGKSILFIAIARASEPIVHIVLRAGANPNGRINYPQKTKKRCLCHESFDIFYNFTPLHYASYCNSDSKIMLRLMEAGAREDARVNVLPGWCGTCPKHIDLIKYHGCTPQEVLAITHAGEGTYVEHTPSTSAAAQTMPKAMFDKIMSFLRTA